MKKINSQDDLDQLVHEIDWSDAFIREWFLLSPGYVNPDTQGTVAAEVIPSMYVLICTPDPACPGIEFFFEEVENVQIYFSGDMNPVAKYHKSRVLFYFFGDSNYSIVSKSLYYRLLSKECWDWKTRYGKESFYDENGFLLTDNFR